MDRERKIIVTTSLHATDVDFLNTEARREYRTLAGLVRRYVELQIAAIRKAKKKGTQ